MEEVNSKKIVSSISWSFAEKLLTDIISTIITIVLARLLLPEDYGLVALVQVFINISMIFVSTGLSTALIQNKDVDEDIISTVFYINFIIGLIIYVVLFILAPEIARFRNNIDLCAILRVLAIKIPISSIYNMQHAYVKKRLQFKKYFMSSLAGTIISGVIGVWMAYEGYGAWALVWSVLIDLFMDSMTLLFTTRWFPKFKLSYKKSRKTINFGIKILLKEFIVRFSTQLRSLIIGIKYNNEDLAFSSKGQKLPQLVSDLTESTIVRVMLPVFSSFQDDKEKMKEMVRSTIGISVFLIAPFMIGMLVTSYRFVPLILTEKWIPCIPYLQIWCINYLFNQITHTDARVIEACGKGNMLLKVQILDTTVELLLIYLVIKLLNNPIYIVASSIISRMIILCVFSYCTNKLIEYDLKDHFKDIFFSITISTIMAIIVYMIGLLPFGDLIILIIQICIGIITYVSLSIVCKNKNAMYIIDFIKKKNNKE